MSGSYTRVRWHQPGLSPLREESARLIATAAPIPDDRNALLDILSLVGIPIVEGADTASQYAVELLKLAAEVEHALMVQYLYAAASLPDDPGRDSVNYHGKLMDVAIQEMGHLATVQNLLLLVGGREALYMQRDAMRQISDKNPIPFVLEPISLPSLAKYVAAEMPAQVPPELAVKVDELVQLAAQSAGVDTHRVGVIYGLLGWIFTPPGEAEGKVDFAALAPLPNKPHLCDDDLSDASEIAQHEALAEEWHVFEPEIILLTAHTCAEARQAIEQIAEQGEGLQNKDASHFGEFMEMVAAFEANRFVVEPIATSPTLGAHGGEGGEVISHPYARLWGETFSIQYDLLVLTIYHALITPRSSDGDAGLRGDLAALALRGMREVIGPISSLVGSLPLRADGSSHRAGPPYDLDPSILESSVDHDLRDQHLRLLERLVSLYAAVAASPEFGTRPNDSIELANLRMFDKRRRNLFQ